MNIESALTAFGVGSFAVITCGVLLYRLWTEYKINRLLPTRSGRIILAVVVMLSVLSTWAGVISLRHYYLRHLQSATQSVNAETFKENPVGSVVIFVIAGSAVFGLLIYGAALRAMILFVARSQNPFNILPNGLNAMANIVPFQREMQKRVASRRWYFYMNEGWRAKLRESQEYGPFREGAWHFSGIDEFAWDVSLLMTSEFANVDAAFVDDVTGKMESVDRNDCMRWQTGGVRLADEEFIFVMKPTSLPSRIRAVIEKPYNPGVNGTFLDDLIEEDNTGILEQRFHATLSNLFGMQGMKGEKESLMLNESQRFMREVEGQAYLVATNHRRTTADLLTPEFWRTLHTLNTWCGESTGILLSSRRLVLGMNKALVGLEQIEKLRALGTSLGNHILNQLNARPSPTTEEIPGKIIVAGANQLDSLDVYARLQSKADEIMAEMKRLDYWQHDPLPAGVNTVTLTQWVQFVILPEVNTAASARGAIPPHDEITVRALSEFSNRPEAGKLLAMLVALEDLMILVKKSTV